MYMYGSRKQWNGNRQLRDARSLRRPLFWLLGPRSAESQNARSSARRSRLEAVLFLAREPMSLRKLAQLANLTDATEARTVLAGLQKRYDDRQCAFQVAQVAGGYQLMSRREFVTW